MLRKAAPRTSELLEPLATLSAGGIFGSAQAVAAQFSTPEFKRMIETLWQLNDFCTEHRRRIAELNAEIEQMGYPSFMGGMAGVPFDAYSDFLRGTLLSLSDLYTNPEYIERYIDEEIEKTLDMIRSTKGQNEGKHVFMALHKGMDGFMSDEHYRKYYWKHLQQIILAIIESEKVLHIYTEGRQPDWTASLKRRPKSVLPLRGWIWLSQRSWHRLHRGRFPASLLDWGTWRQPPR